MTSRDIIAIIVTLIGVISFATLFTILYQSYASSQIAEIKSGKRDIEIIDEVIYERQKHIQRRRKVAGYIRSVAFYVIIVLLVPIFIFSLINKIVGNQMMIGGNTVMVVASGSMSEKHPDNTYLVSNGLNNQFNQYDIIVLQKLSRSPKLYDVIAFRNDKGINVIHRIIDVEYSTTTKYVTRGDSNNATDTYRPTNDDIIGRYTGRRIPSIGIFIIFLQSYSGIITAVSLVYCLIMIDRVSNKMNKVQFDRISKLEEALDFFDETQLKEMKAEYKETIYYKGYAYTFEDGEFKDKFEITEEKLLAKSNDILIKEILDKDKVVTTNVVIDKDDELGDKKND